MFCHDNILLNLCFTSKLFNGFLPTMVKKDVLKVYLLYHLMKQLL